MMFVFGKATRWEVTRMEGEGTAFCRALNPTPAVPRETIYTN